MHCGTVGYGDHWRTTSFNRLGLNLKQFWGEVQVACSLADWAWGSEHLPPQ